MTYSAQSIVEFILLNKCELDITWNPYYAYDTMSCRYTYQMAIGTYATKPQNEPAYQPRKHITKCPTKSLEIVIKASNNSLFDTLCSLLDKYHEDRVQINITGPTTVTKYSVKQDYSKEIEKKNIIKKRLESLASEMESWGAKVKYTYDVETIPLEWLKEEKVTNYEHTKISIGCNSDTKLYQVMKENGLFDILPDYIECY